MVTIKYKNKLLSILIISIVLFSGCWEGFLFGDNGFINLAWNSNKEHNLAGYKIYYGTSSKIYSSSIDVKFATQSTPDTVTYTLRGLKINQKYFIAMTAYNEAGRESGYSEEVSSIAQ